MELHFKNQSFRYQVEHQASICGGMDNVVCLLIEEDDTCHEAFRQDYKELAKLKTLEEIIVEGDGTLDCAALSPLVQLQSLTLSGLFCAYPVSVANLPALWSMKRLKFLEIADFNDIDVAGIDALSSLEEVLIMFGGKVKHIEHVAKLPHLRSLWLTETTIENLDFLQWLSPDVDLDLGGVIVESDVNISLVQRFKNRTCEDIIINGKKYENL